MRYLVSVEPEFHAGNKLDQSPGGPGPLFGYIAERFKPEGFWICADRRKAIWVIDFASASEMHELVHLALARCGTCPEMQPLVSAEEARESIPKAIAAAKAAP
ncbi:MAG: hypothetical protein U0270_43455 [Labilithrix sp.]